MKKIYILINHFQVVDGVAKTAIGLANELAKKPDVEVTLQSLFRFDSQVKDLLSPNVKAKPFLGFYFRGLAKLVGLVPKRWLYRLLVREKYDIEIGYCMTLPIQIVAASDNVDAKHYAWMHGYDKGLTLLKCYRKMDKVIAVAKSVADRFSKETSGEITVKCCYNLVDDEKVRKMGEVNIPPVANSALTFVSVGHLVNGKGYMRLIECCGRIKKEGYDFNLWLIGDGPQRNELEQRVKALGLENVVYFWGMQRNPHAYTAKADVFVCSSYDEGYSTACTEAIMLGIPVISTDVNGAREIIADAQAGMVVSVEDEALYVGMKSILDNPNQIDYWKKTIHTTRDVFSYKNRATELLRTLELDS